MIKKDSIIVPTNNEQQDEMENLELPIENEVVYINENKEMIVQPSPNKGKMAELSLDCVQKFDDIENFELPVPPNTVNVAKPSDDQAAYLWFEYKFNMEKTPVLNWEIKRYKLNKDGLWSYKSSKIFEEKDSDRQRRTRMVRSRFASYIYF